MIAVGLGGIVWRKSSYSGAQSDCVEVAEVVAVPEGEWRKSSYSGQGGNCLEAQTRSAAMAVRDSKEPGGPALVFAADAWASFLAGVKSGEFPTD
ncbi:DUF397 domain-containing protein [Kitasatospora sp. NPDC057542]|uniref:DUF397 domain-containing protein n=1 Tax=Streptomycetaceae TaxID=2062 RepID=UPI001CCC8E05|nr:DUF397 domain-containing protein [Streptomyces sp. LS1784]